VRLTTLPPSCAVVVKCGDLNSLEPSGPPQACNGTDLPLSLPKYYELGTVVDGRIVFEVKGFTDVTLCHSAVNSRRFERTLCLHLQGHAVQEDSMTLGSVLSSECNNIKINSFYIKPASVFAMYIPSNCRRWSDCRLGILSS